MGFWAFRKWASFSKRHIPDMIYQYKEYVLKSPEQREREKNETRTTLAQLIATTAVIKGIVHKRRIF